MYPGDGVDQSGLSRAVGPDHTDRLPLAYVERDVVLIKNDDSPAMFPILNPYGHVAFQAQRGDVHTVLINGRLVKHRHRLVGVDLDRARREVERTVEYLIGSMGRDAWDKGMNPDVPETKLRDNPYTYTEWDAGSAQWKQ